ncbi:hypothetical protein [Tritonibacter aquimaris]|uniref:hypothetical protein n=1 Tax=Tritonibacter aquimaris TaxID=2663379 RepID=UPI001F15798D|nr:hypothetical protein [Tritonibacter aquimaris]
MDVLLGRGKSARILTVLDCLIGTQRDNRLMVALAAFNAPRFMLDISSINNTLENIADLLLADMTARQVFGKRRLAFEETLYLDLRSKAP